MLAIKYKHVNKNKIFCLLPEITRAIKDSNLLSFLLRCSTRPPMGHPMRIELTHEG